MTDADELSQQVRELALGWFRNTSGIDQTEKNGISIGSTLSMLIWQVAASMLRYSIRFEESHRHGKIPTIWQDASPLEQRIALAFGTTQQLQVSRSLVPQLDKQMISPAMLKVPLAARAAWRVQSIFHSRIDLPEHLWLADWTTHHVSRGDPRGTVLYRRSLHRSAIPHTDAAAWLEAGSYFPKNIDGLFSRQLVWAFVTERNYGWPDYVVTALCHYVQEVYKDIRGLLIEASAQTLSMLEFYSPLKVFLPDDKIETWNLWYQFCQHRGVETVMYNDGYTVIPWFPILKNSNNTSWLVSRIAAYGSAQAEMYQNHGYPSTKIDVVAPPFLMHQRHLNPRHNEFDAVVLTWTSQNLKPASDGHSPATTLATVLRTLNKCGKKKLAIKVRCSVEIPYVKHVIRNLGIEAVILEGYLWQHLAKSPLFIGGVSSALAEVAASGAQYVVYEPLDNGYSDFDIAKSTVISRKTVARDSGELEEFILRGTSSWIGQPEFNLLK
jgi:hypothetical protein